MEIYIVIDNYGGVIQDVQAFQDESDADRHFKNYCGFTVEDYYKAIESDESRANSTVNRDSDMQLHTITVQ